MRLLTPIQLLVIRTNAYWPFSRLNRLPYYLAIWMFKRLCGRAPEIHSAYLRHSMAEGRWEPGLSDIDLSVLLVPGMSDSDEFAFISRFRRSFGRLTKFFPMIGELEILPLEYMGSWCLFSTRGRGVGRWVLLHGKDFRIDAVPQSLSETEADRLSYAIYVYEYSFLNRVLNPVRGRTLEIEFLRRLSLKIAHYAGVPYPKPSRIPRNATTEYFQLEIIRFVEMAAARLSSNKTVPPFEGNPCRSPAEPLPILDDTEVTPVLLSLVEAGSHIFAIVDPAASDSELLTALARLRQSLVRESGKLFVLGPAGFAFLFARKEPYRYTALSRDRVVCWGEDPLPGIAPPDEYAYVHRIASQFSMALATFPHGPELQRLRDPDIAVNRVYRSVLKRILLIRFLIEEASPVPHSARALDKACQQRYDRVFEQFDVLTETRLADLAFRLYRMYREHLDFVNRNMGKLPTHEGPIRIPVL